MAPRPELSKYAPKMLSLKIDPDKIREVIGSGGKVIQKICAECRLQRTLCQGTVADLPASGAAAGAGLPHRVGGEIILLEDHGGYPGPGGLLWRHGL